MQMCSISIMFYLPVIVISIWYWTSNRVLFPGKDNFFYSQLSSFDYNSLCRVEDKYFDSTYISVNHVHVL